MPLEFPAVSQSRVEFWGKPQFTQKGMLLFTIFFGMFGLHHFLLRSPQTGLLVLIVNVLTFGYPYFFDIIQLSTKTHEELQEKGLDLPWSVAGIAQGMWINPDAQETSQQGPMVNALRRFGRKFMTCKPDPSEVKDEGVAKLEPVKEAEAEAEPAVGAQVGGAEEEEEVGPPNPYWFFLYSILLPLAPISRLIAGDTDNALLGLLNLTIIPLGFLFLAVSIVNEYYMIFAKPADVLYNGIHRVFPFTKLGYAEKGFSPRLTGGVIEEECGDESVFVRLFKGLYRSILPAPIVAAIDTVPATVQTVKTQVIDRGFAAAKQVKNTVTKVASTAGKVADIATKIPASAAAMQKTIQQATNPEELKKRLASKLPAAPTMQSLVPPVPLQGATGTETTPRPSKPFDINMISPWERSLASFNPPSNILKPAPEPEPAPIPSAPRTEKVREAFAPTPVTGTMVGGGLLDTKDKVVTGGILALLLGGFVLHTGRSAWNAIQDVRSASDLPPSLHA